MYLLWGISVVAVDGGGGGKEDRGIGGEGLMNLI